MRKTLILRVRAPLSSQESVVVNAIDAWRERFEKCRVSFLVLSFPSRSKEPAT